MAELIGYARVSTDDQHPEAQHDALEAAGCSRVFEERVSGTRRERPELAAALAYARRGDTLVVTSLDRLARNLHHLLELAAGLEAGGVNLRVLDVGIDTSTAAGRLVFQVFGAIAEFVAAIGRERTRAGLAAARARGRKGGRPTVWTADKIEAAVGLRRNGYSIGHVARALGISPSAVSAKLRELDESGDSS